MTVSDIAFRPWGRFEWLLSKLPRKRWHVVGALSTEDRCLSVLRRGQATIDVESAYLLEIVDEESDFSEPARMGREANRARLERLVEESRREVSKMELLDPIISLKQKMNQWAMRAPKNVALDVSALPKRVYFPLIRWLLENPVIENLVITYMKPDRYTTEALAYNAREWAQLPTFVANNVPPDPPIEKLVVGVGFLPFGLPDLLKHHYHELSAKITRILPFPSHPTAVQRTWDFVRHIDAETRLETMEQIQRVNADDLAGCFDRLNRATRGGVRKTVYAPYEPKPH